MSEQDNAKRLIELESRLSFQEDLLAAVNQSLVEQDKTLRELHMQLRHLNDKLKQSQDADPFSDPASERPPHY